MSAFSFLVLYKSRRITQFRYAFKHLIDQNWGRLLSFALTFTFDQTFSLCSHVPSVLRGQLARFFAYSGLDRRLKGMISAVL